MQDLALIPAGQLQFRLFIQEEYNDNVTVVAQGRESDFITRISPTLAVNRITGNTSLNLRYAPQFLLYARFPELNRTDHTLVLNGSWQATPSLRLSLQDNLLITQNAVEEISPLGISQAGLNQTTQNMVSPALDIRLTSQSNLTLRYRNTIIDEDQGEDRIINGGSIAWRYSHPRGTVSLDYSPAYVDRQSSGNAFNHRAILHTSYNVGPRDDLSLTVAGSFVDEEEADDSAVVGADVGLDHQFNPQLRMRLTGGAQVFGLADGNPLPRFSTDSSLTWTFPRGSLKLGVAQRFENTFATVDNVGVVLDSRGSATFSYQVGPGFNLSVNGSYSRVEFQEQDNTDYVGRVGINIGYQLGILGLNAGYYFFNRDSDQPGNDLTSNRVYIGISIGYAVPLPLF